jgi:hypothetical protein
MKNIKELKKELQEAEARLPQIGIDKKSIMDRLETAKRKHSRVESQIENLRKERQTILVDGGGLEDVNARLKEVRESDEHLEDEITGLTNKLSSLDKEERNLAAKATDLGKQILKEGTVRPLVEKYNEVASELAKVLALLYEAIHVYKKTFFSTGDKLVRSNPDNFGIHSLPAVWMYGEEPIPEHHNGIAIGMRLENEDRRKHMKAQYPECKCFECAEYAGVDQTFMVRCKRLEGEVPKSILTGQVTKRVDLENLRCVFSPQKE